MLSAFGRLLSLMRPHRRGLVLSVLLGIAAAAFSLSPHLAVGATLVELAVGERRPGAMAAYAALGMVGVVLRHLCYGLSMLLSHRIAYAAQYELRRRMAERLARVPLGFFDGRPAGTLRATMMQDVDQVEDGMAHLVPEGLAALLTPLLLLAFMAVLDWRLALLALAPTAFGLWLVGRVIRRGADVTRSYQAASARMAHAATEYAEGLATIRAFDQVDQALDRARAAIGGYSSIAIAWLRRSVAPGSVAQAFLAGNLLLAGPAGLLLHATGAVEAWRLILLLVLSVGLGDLFAGIAGLAHRLTRQVAVLDRIGAMLDAAEQPVAAAPVQPRDGSVVFENVSLSLGGRRVLDGVSFSVEPGRCVALVGGSGAGKSTVMRLVSRFHDVDAGRVLVGGVDVREQAPDALQRHLAIVFQDVFLFEGSVRDNILLGRSEATDEEVRAAARAANAESFIERLPDGYGTRLGERGAGLSGGERQRLSIARALLKDAPILLLDEATAFADPESEAAIQEALSRLAAGRTVIVVAHRLHTVVNADEILVLDRGRIAERGSHAALLAEGGRYAALWRAGGAAA